MLRKNIFIGLILMLFIACQKNDTTSPDEVINLNLLVTIPQSGGLTLKANYTGIKQNEINESGFLISTQNIPNFDNSELISGKNSNGFFENNVNTDLIYNNEYFIRAYLKVGVTDIYYSDEQSFISIGSKPPIVNEVTQSHILDTITISGNYFTQKTNNIQVLFGDEKGRVITSNDTIIKCVVPETIKQFDPTIEVKVYEKNVKYNNFSLFKPEITSVSSLSATFREELIITGDHFDFDISRNKVYFGNIEAPMSYANRNIIKVLVPDDLEMSIEEIKVVAQLQQTTNPENFQLIPPEIKLVPQNVYTNQEIVIEGDYFHPIKEKNKVTFENAETNLSFGDTKTLNTKVPFGPFPRRKAIVKVQLLDLIVEYEVELNILDKWVMVSNDLPMRYYGLMHNAIVANNMAYVITKSKDIFDETKYLWKLNSEDFSWEQLNIPFNIDVYEESGGVVESDGINIYVYLPNNLNDFWEYNTTSSTWSKKAAFIGSKRSGATHFSVNGEIYLGIGIDSEPSQAISYYDFYKYNPSTNIWSQISNLPVGSFEYRRYTGAFVINGIGYFTGGAYNTGDTDCWSYNPSSDTWLRIADFSTPRNSTASFSLGDFGYVTGGSPIGGSNRKDCWRYEPLTNTWTKIDDVGHIARGRHFSFTLNGKAYIGGGGIYDSGGSNGYDFYEFEP